MRAWMIGLAATAVCVACGGSSSSDGTAGGGGSSGSGGAGASGGAAGGSAGSGGSSASSGSAGTSGASGSAGAPDACLDPALKSCSGSAECVLASSDCCLCGMPEITDFVAMNQAHAQKCTCAGPACGCATSINPNLAATCDASIGQCIAWDIRTTDAYSSCSVDTDCRLRMGLGCCEGCSADTWGLVAIRVDAVLALESAVCAPGMACPECEPVYPPEAKALCISGHCQVVVPL